MPPEVSLGVGSTDQSFPRDLASVTSGWLSKVLGKSVTSFDSTALEMGALSDFGLLKLKYSGDAATRHET